MKEWVKKSKKRFRKRFRTVLSYLKNLDLVSFSPAPRNKQIIICFDGKVFHGGLVDRLKGIISFFQVAQLTDADFKIFFKHPFPLEFFFEPNQLNWVATENDLRWNPFHTKILYLMEEFRADPIELIRASRFKKFLVYCNVDYFDRLFPDASVSERNNCWGIAFKKLFQNSELLEKALISKELGNNRIAVHTRFLSALGDFWSFSKRILSENDQMQLMEKCKRAIEKIMEVEQEKVVYVFSDSVKFLNYIKQNPAIYILDGEIKHSELDITKDHEEHLKTFLDFIAIAGSQKVYLIKSKEMYNSNFSRYASKIHGAEFSIINV